MGFTRAPREHQGIPEAALQQTFRLAGPPKAGETSYLVVPGDGSAESGQGFYLRFRTTPEDLGEFLASLDKATSDLAADDAVLDQDDIAPSGFPGGSEPRTTSRVSTRTSPNRATGPARPG